MSKEHTTQRQVTYKNLSKEEVQRFLDLGYNPKDLTSAIVIKNYETKMSKDFFKWLEKCPVKYMHISNNNYNCHYSFYFDEVSDGLGNN